MKNCAYCNRQNLDDAKLCFHCGRDLTESVARNFVAETPADGRPPDAEKNKHVNKKSRVISFIINIGLFLVEGGAWLILAEYLGIYSLLGVVICIFGINVTLVTGVYNLLSDIKLDVHEAFYGFSVEKNKRKRFYRYMRILFLVSAPIFVKDKYP